MIRYKNDVEANLIARNSEEEDKNVKSSIREERKRFSSNLPVRGADVSKQLLFRVNGEREWATDGRKAGAFKMEAERERERRAELEDGRNRQEGEGRR